MLDIKRTLKKTMLGVAAVATLGGVTLAATSASADRDDAGWALGAGALGFALGATLSHPAYGEPPGYYAGPAYYTYDDEDGCRYVWHWSRYWGRYVRTERCY